MTWINIPNKMRPITKQYELQSFLKIYINPCKCKMPPLKLHYSHKKYKLTCMRCKRRVGTMEIHGNIIVSVKDVHRFIKIVTEKYQSSLQTIWKLTKN